jgi:hypothetical protein
MLAHRPSSTPLPRSITVITVVAVTTMFIGSYALRAQEAPIGFGTADTFAVLAGSTITNTGLTTITGDVGLHPGTAVVGFDDVTLDGELHVADTVAETAKADLVAAYNDAAGRGPATAVVTELGGQTLTEGIYNSASGTFGMTGTLTLDADGDPDAVFIFQMVTTLITAANSDVDLINGADACNVFWQVGSSATLGAGTSFMGNILALTSISLGTGASVEGRVLAQTGAVTLGTNAINQGTCEQATGTTTTTVDDSTTTTVDDSTTTTVDDSTTTTVDDSTTTTVDDSTTTTVDDSTTTTVDDSTTTTVDDSTTTTVDDSTTTTVGDSSPTTSGDTATTTAAISTNSTFQPPRGGADTGGGSTSGGQNVILLLGVGVLLLGVATAAFAARRHSPNGPSTLPGPS